MPGIKSRRTRARDMPANQPDSQGHKAEPLRQFRWSAGDDGHCSRRPARENGERARERQTGSERTVEGKGKRPTGEGGPGPAMGIVLHCSSRKAARSWASVRGWHGRQMRSPRCGPQDVPCPATGAFLEPRVAGYMVRPAMGSAGSPMAGPRLSEPREGKGEMEL